MRTLPVLRVTAAAAAGVAVSFGVAPAANATGGTIPINGGNVPATAANYEHECSAQLGGGPYPGKDVWVFNLPGKAATTGSFTSIRAMFDTNGDGKSDSTVVIDAGAADGDDIVTVGHSKAYVITDAGWTLIDANATITGKADKFVLTHTCAATGTTTTGPTTKPTTTASTSSTPTSSTPTESTAPTGSSSSSGSTGGGSGAEGSGSAEGSGEESLPVTGLNVAGVAALGLGLVGGGAALVLRRRRRFIA
ncbi:LPXTG cell wall anchor domain-containing protein [Actinoplanes oblitus]|uniref:LPXTG cell wall anchor domain-containing protein n=1 Tax=Actinoplanes oblitus TaxID=3040509 RepID=A0ABY8WQL6_9ACTN|nr:LPXTG cell wall anchor domain-containing protein [Actinoplanes oblitus]WIN00151.1 LPXTG cell wall anchor domain-containing protein [Actinoplanes oblitus]